jgi:hypothetical protein
LVCDAGEVRVFFRNNFNFQHGLDGGVLEVNYDGGLTFEDVLAAGGTFVHGGYKAQSTIAAAIPWLAGRHGLITPGDLSTPP